MGYDNAKHLLSRAIQAMVFLSQTALRPAVTARRVALGLAGGGLVPPHNATLGTYPCYGPWNPLGPWGLLGPPPANWEQQCMIAVDGMTCMMEQHSRRFSDTPRTSFVNDPQPFRGSQCP